VRIDGYPSASASALSMMRSAESLAVSAAGNTSDLTDAAVALSEAKISMGVAATLSRTQDEMLGSLLDMLV
jgi:hypothetical protein